jgi:hypothetical protein
LYNSITIGMVDMRFLLGIIVGVFLTIGAAYVSDASTARTSASTTQSSADQRPMVNWDVVSRNWQSLSLGVRQTWDRLASRSPPSS